MSLAVAFGLVFLFIICWVIVLVIVISLREERERKKEIEESDDPVIKQNLRDCAGLS